MIRESKFFAVDDLPAFREKLLHWGSLRQPFLWLEGSPSEPDNPHGPFPNWAAAEAVDSLLSDSGSLQKLRLWHASKRDFVFGFLSYELKDELEDLRSENPTDFPVPHLFFFQARWIFQFQADGFRLSWLPEIDNSDQADRLFVEIVQGPGATEAFPTTLEPPSSMSREHYLEQVEALRLNLRRGDIYEINYCQNFRAMAPGLRPDLLYKRLVGRKPPPFSAFFRWNDLALACASPERFLKKDSRRLVSQPIKGTAARGKDSAADQQARTALLADLKELAENVMIVDLVRNDLAKVCLGGSVRVDELCEIYRFQDVFQLISTVSGIMAPEADAFDALAAAFPMGSMTGAPKRRACQLIEQRELFRRGLYSGSIGYISPEADFDFNVVIRSALLHLPSGRLSYPAGSAITYASRPEGEWQECRVKAGRFFDLFNKLPE